MQIIAAKVLSALSHAAGIGVVWRAGRNWDRCDDAGGNNLVLGRSGGDLGCGGCTGEDESYDESTDDECHGMTPLEIILDNFLKIKGLAARETIGPEPCRRH